MVRFALGRTGCLVFLSLILTGSILQAFPVNDHFANRLQISGISGIVTGTNLAATKEPGEPDHAGNPGGSSVWWSWTATQNGTAMFSTEGSDFDSLLAVYTGTFVSSLTLVAADDDSGQDLTSKVTFDVVKGMPYQIAVDGYDGEIGPIELTWFMYPPCPAPPEASRPSPGSGAKEVPVYVTLSWIRGRNALRKTIYGRDDRLDIYEVKNPDHVSAWDSTVALVDRVDLRDNGNQTFTLVNWDTFGELEGLCPGEPFINQPTPAWCSGFLVGPDLVATAGHCMELPDDCDLVAFIFGFKMLDATTPVLTFPQSQVYSCKKIVGMELNDEGADWAIVQLDRSVPDHKPLRVRRTEKVPNGQRLLVIGYPEGLPGKIAGGAWVQDNDPLSYFIANLDVLGGSSGSPVLNEDTLMVEGILVRGDIDFVEQGFCWVHYFCPDNLNDLCLGEDVTRSTEFDHLVPPNQEDVMFKVFFGPCGNLSLLGTTGDTSWRVEEELLPQTTYCWRVDTVGECGTSQGNIWTFTTATKKPPIFSRGDPNEDFLTDISDAIAILFYIFESLEPPCALSADVNADDEVNLTDVIRLLTYLFLEGESPAEPFFACASRPEPLGLRCLSYDPCGW